MIEQHGCYQNYLGGFLVLYLGHLHWVGVFEEATSGFCVYLCMSFHTVYILISDTHYDDFLRRSRGSWFPQNEQAGVTSTHFPIIMNVQLFTLPLFPLLVIHCIIHSEPLTGLRCTCLSANSRATRQIYSYVPHQLLTTSFRHIQPSPLLA